MAREGLVLHGGAPVAQRRELVERLQADELTPFFVLSLKAGGAGLNLTAASHVIHLVRANQPAAEKTQIPAKLTDDHFQSGRRYR